MTDKPMTVEYTPPPPNLMGALLDILAHVDYTGYGGCLPTELIGSVLPESVLRKAHEAINHDRKKNKLHEIKF
jgi:hypothetical protein